MEAHFLSSFASFLTDSSAGEYIMIAGEYIMKYKAHNERPHELLLLLYLEE